MGEQTGEGAGSGPALHGKGVLIVLAVMIDPVRWRALPGLLTMAHEHDDFRGCSVIGHET